MACGGNDATPPGDGGIDTVAAVCVPRRIEFDASEFQHASDNSIAAAYDGKRLVIATIGGIANGEAITVRLLDEAGVQWQKQAGLTPMPAQFERTPEIAIAMGGDKVAVAWTILRPSVDTPRPTQIMTSEFTVAGIQTVPATVMTRPTYGINASLARKPRLVYWPGANQFVFGWTELRVEMNDTVFTSNAFIKVGGGPEQLVALARYLSPEFLGAQIESFGFDGATPYVVSNDLAQGSKFSMRTLSAQSLGPINTFYPGGGSGIMQTTAKVGAAFGYVKLSGVAGEAGISTNGVPRTLTFDDSATAGAVVATATNFIFAYQAKGDFPFRVVDVSPNGVLGRERYTAPRIANAMILQASLEGNALQLTWLKEETATLKAIGETICLEP